MLYISIETLVEMIPFGQFSTTESQLSALRGFQKYNAKGDFIYNLKLHFNTDFR